MILTNPVIRDAERRAGKVSELGAAFACSGGKSNEPFTGELVDGKPVLNPDWWNSKKFKAGPKLIEYIEADGLEKVLKPESLRVYKVKPGNRTVQTSILIAQTRPPQSQGQWSHMIPAKFFQSNVTQWFVPR